MKANKTERLQAEQVSMAIEQRLSESDAQTKPVELADTGVLATAEQLARLPALLGPVDAAFEGRVMRQVRTGLAETRPRPRFRVGWAVAGLAAVLLAVMIFTPLGQTAVASFMAVFSLGRTEVRITPVNTASVPLATAVAAEDTAIRELLTLEEARAQLPFHLPQPASLPPGYSLGEVSTYSYPELSAWIPQPLFAELAYRDGQGSELVLRVYPITLGDDASISGLNLQAAPIRDVQDVDVNGQPGILMSLGSERTERIWKEVVWEQGDLVLALSAIDLTESELLETARTVH